MHHDNPPIFPMRRRLWVFGRHKFRILNHGTRFGCYLVPPHLRPEGECRALKVLLPPSPRMYRLCTFPAILLSLYVYRRWKKRSLSDIPGPKSTSLLLGWLSCSYRFHIANDPQATREICYTRTPLRWNSCGRRSSVAWPV